MSSFFIGCFAKAACSSDEMPKWQVSLFPMDEIEPPDYPDLISWPVGRLSTVCKTILSFFLLVRIRVIGLANSHSYRDSAQIKIFAQLINQISQISVWQTFRIAGKNIK